MGMKTAICIGDYKQMAYFINMGSKSKKILYFRKGATIQIDDMGCMWSNGICFGNKNVSRAALYFTYENGGKIYDKTR